jgi:hypothetical protein
MWRNKRDKIDFYSLHKSPCIKSFRPLLIEIIRFLKYRTKTLNFTLLWEKFWKTCNLNFINWLKHILMMLVMPYKLCFLWQDEKLLMSKFLNHRHSAYFCHPSLRRNLFFLIKIYLRWFKLTSWSHNILMVLNWRNVFMMRKKQKLEWMYLVDIY